MSKIAVVYWSGTGNTQAMAEAVAKAFRKRARRRCSCPCRRQMLRLFSHVTPLHSAAPQWVRKFWKKANSNPSSNRRRPGSPERKPLCSVLMAGVTASGCATGPTAWRRTAAFWSPSPSQPTKLPTTMRSKPAGLSADVSPESDICHPPTVLCLRSSRREIAPFTRKNIPPFPAGCFCIFGAPLPVDDAPRAAYNKSRKRDSPGCNVPEREPLVFRNIRKRERRRL